MKKAIILALVGLMFVLTTNISKAETVILKDANASKVQTALKDYMGVNNYSFNYANDETGSYSVLLKKPDLISVVKITEPTKDQKEDQAVNKEVKVYKTNPTLMVLRWFEPHKTAQFFIKQKGNDVIIQYEVKGGWNKMFTTTNVLAFIDYLRDSGYIFSKDKPQEKSL